MELCVLLSASGGLKMCLKIKLKALPAVATQSCLQDILKSLKMLPVPFKTYITSKIKKEFLKTLNFL